MSTRREAMRALLGASIAGALAAPLGALAQTSGGEADAIGRRLAALERQAGGRLGVAILDTGSGARAGRREHERFPMCSTSKFLLAGLVLSRVDRGAEHLTRRVTFSTRELVDYSPTTSRHVGGEGMSVAALCEAALTLSDNTAANLLLAASGGPAGVTAFARSLGDAVTRLDRNEPTLNEGTPGDPRDTTTPAAMLDNLRALLVGTRLSPASRARLLNWLVANRTGDARLRAGLPKGWRVGDKTGSGGHGSTNDIAIVEPPGRAPLLMTVYLTQTAASEPQRAAVFAEIGRNAALLAAR